MTLSEAIGTIETIFLDTAPVIYFIEAHDQFGPLVKQVVELMDKNRIQAFTSVLTLAEVLPKPMETGNEELAEKFKTYLKNGQNLTLLPITDNIGEGAGVLRGRYPHLKTMDAVQIAAALDAEAEAFLTNDKKLSGIKEIKIIVLSDYLDDTRGSDRI
ncbi:MAG TPA: PIN domain-containing protein [Syntrophales bacterium]|jgi:predicted nucleic acid-binding protein|nr:PIN domain-containing protein [Syntrophales bacterium]HPC33971.1 PIN domain-containing protein [Syntrophales bacterium]HQG35509.1 PIN domain-containing protein [Syntrophales bacterium]HQI36872.1 PIN domain-containing protein [Syntrophales bacterium]